MTAIIDTGLAPRRHGEFATLEDQPITVVYEFNLSGPQKGRNAESSARGDLSGPEGCH